MGDIIYIPNGTARYLNDIRGALSVYKPRNSDGRYNTAIDKYTNMYKSGLKNLLVTDSELAVAA